MKHKALWIAAAVIAAIIVVVLFIPFFIDVNQFRPSIESTVSTALNRKVQIGNIHLSVFSGGAAVGGISIADDPAFSNGPFLTAKSVKANVQLLPLIFSKRIEVDEFTIEQPEVTLLKNSKGTWNYSSLGASGQATSNTKSGGNSAANISVAKLEISGGKILVGDAASSKRHEYDNVDFNTSNLSYTTQFPFTLKAQTPGNGTVNLDGKMGPLNQSNMQQTPFSAKVDVKNFDLGATGFVDPSAGIGGLVDFSGTVSSDGHKLNSNGTATANKLRALPGSAPATVPINVDYQVNYDIEPQTGTLNQGDVLIGKAGAHLTGTFNASGDVVSVQMKLNGQNMPAPDLEGVLPAIGVTLPRGSSLQSGALNVDLAIAGPVDQLVTQGPVNLSNAKLANFNIGSKLGALSQLSGVPKVSDTTIQTFSANMKIAPTGIRADNVNLVVAGIGALTGNGTISPQNALDFKMAAKLGKTESSSGGQVASVLGGGQQSGGIPFLIEGTTSDPKFVPDMKGLVKQFIPAKGSQGVGNALGGLFGKKKQ